MWLTSNRPADVRTASCSSLTLRYCCGISQPANSTMRAPAATWFGWRGVRLPAIRAVVVLSERVQVHLVELDVLQDLLVVAAAGVGDHQADLAGPLQSPLQLGGQLQLGGRPAQLAMRVLLGLDIVVRRLEEQLAVLNRLLLVPERPVHVVGDQLPRVVLEVTPAAPP